MLSRTFYNLLIYLSGLRSSCNPRKIPKFFYSQTTFDKNIICLNDLGNLFFFL